MACHRRLRQTRSMNENTTPGSPSEEHDSAENDFAEHVTADNAAQEPRGFFDWLRGLGIERSSSDRWFAGVASGIAARAGIDPLIVRGVFVVLAILGGPGLLLYLAGWLLLPNRSGTIHAEEIVRGRAQTGTVVTAAILLGLLVLPILLGISFNVWNWGPWTLVPEWMSVTMTVIFWAVLVPGLIVWFVIWLSTGNSGSRPDGGPSEPGAQRAASARQNAEEFGRKAEEWGEDFSRKAEQWGDDVNRKAREWEERHAEEHAARRFGAGPTLVSLALALLGGGLTLLWAMGAGISSPYTAAIIVASAVLGVAAIIAGVRGRDTGWVGFFSLAGVVALFFTSFSAAAPQQTEIVPFGNVTINATDNSENRAVLMVGGNATVDLSELGRPDGGAAPRVIEVWQLAGNVTVELPASHPARVQVGLAAGNVRDERGSFENRQGGIFMGRTLEASAAGSTGSDATVVRVRLLAGNVYVEGPR